MNLQNTFCIINKHNFDNNMIITIIEQIRKDNMWPLTWKCSQRLTFESHSLAIRTGRDTIRMARAIRSKKLASIRMDRAIRSKKLASVQTAWAIHSKKLSAFRTVWAIHSSQPFERLELFIQKKLAAFGTVRAVLLKKNSSSVGKKNTN